MSEPRRAGIAALRALDRLLGGVCLVYLRLSQVLLAALVIGIFGEVVLRYFFGRAILGSGELAKLAIVWIVFLMAAVLHRRRRHIVITVMVDALSFPMRVAADRLVSAGTIVLTFFVILQFVHTVPFLRLTTPVFEIPDLAFDVALVFGFVPIALQSAVDIFWPPAAAADN